MNPEKLSIFINLIDKAIAIAEERRNVMQTEEFYQKCKEAGWIKQEDIDLGKDHLEKKHSGIFHYEFLDRNIIEGLKILRKRAENNEIEEWVMKYPKGRRGNFGMTRGISDCGHEMWGDALYNYEIYDACGAIEDYFNLELE